MIQCLYSQRWGKRHKTLGWQPTSEQQDLLQKLYQGVVAGNRQLNLTRITEPMVARAMEPAMMAARIKGSTFRSML